VRDLGIATRGLTAWQSAGYPPGTPPSGFAQHVRFGTELLVSAWSRFSDVLAFEGVGALPDPDEPGTALCHAARDAILAWREPSGTSHDRDAVLCQLIAATRFLSAAMASLAACAPRHLAISLQAAGADLTAAVTTFAAAIEERGCSRVLGTGTREAPRHREDPE
jgi:hypothetical protein